MKEHKKMYKAGKNWVVATLAIATFGVAGTFGQVTNATQTNVVAHADTDRTTPTNDAIKSNAESFADLASSFASTAAADQNKIESEYAANSSAYSKLWSLGSDAISLNAEASVTYAATKRANSYYRHSENRYYTYDDGADDDANEGYNLDANGGHTASGRVDLSTWLQESRAADNAFSAAEINKESAESYAASVIALRDSAANQLAKFETNGTAYYNDSNTSAEGVSATLSDATPTFTYSSTLDDAKVNITNSSDVRGNYRDNVNTFASLASYAASKADYVADTTTKGSDVNEVDLYKSVASSAASYADDFAAQADNATSIINSVSSKAFADKSKGDTINNNINSNKDASTGFTVYGSTSASATTSSSAANSSAASSSSESQSSATNKTDHSAANKAAAKKAAAKKRVAKDKKAVKKAKKAAKKAKSKKAKKAANKKLAKAEKSLKAAKKAYNKLAK